MPYLKQSTAVTVKIGPFVDNADGFTPLTGLTLSQADIRVSKNGGAFAQKNNASAATHDENGWYDCTLSTTDTNTLGTLRIAINESGALPVFDTFTVLAANVFDALIAGTDLLDVQVFAMNANTITAAAVATGAIDADALATDGVDEIAAAVAAAVDTAAISAEIAAVQTVVDDLDTRIPASLLNGKMRATNQLFDSTADSGTTTTFVDAAITALPDDQIVGNWVEFTSGNAQYNVRLITDFDSTTNTVTFTPAATSAILVGDNYNVLPAASVASGPGGAPTAAEIADAVWDEPTAGHVGAGTFGPFIDFLSEIHDDTVASFGTTQDMIDAVQEGVDVIIPAVTALPTASQTADAVWDEPRAGHVTAGTYGQGVTSVQGAVTGSVGSVATGGITAASFAANAISEPAVAANTFTAAKFASDCFTAAKFATDFIGATELSAAAANKIADHVLRRSYSSARLSSDGDAVSFRSMLGSVAKMVNRWRVSGPTLAIYHEDDTTIFGSQTLTATVGADPITEVDTV